jgi:predicted amidohydrolase YtcJ
MHVAVHRRPPDEPGAEPLLADEALSVQQALAGYTTGSAWVNRLDGTTGRIEVGYAADLAVVDRDVLAEDGARLGATRVLRTYTDGRLVFSGP